MPLGGEDVAFSVPVPAACLADLLIELFLS